LATIPASNPSTIHAMIPMMSPSSSTVRFDQPR
jgi:hypothetical protein